MELNRLYKILILHSEKQQVPLIVQKLKEEKYAIDSTSNLDYFLNQTVSETIHLVIIENEDINIVIEICKKLKNSLKSSHIPIYLIASKIEKPEKLELLRNGILEIVDPCCETDEIRAKISTLLKTIEQTELFAERSLELNKSDIIKKINQDLISLNTEMVDKNRELEQIKENIVESERHYKLFFENMVEGVAINELIFDENGEAIDYKILDVNPAFYSVGDYKNRQVIGNVATVLYKMPVEEIKRFWLSHKSNTQPINSEFKSFTSDKWFYITTSPFYNNRFITTFFDITQIKKYEQELIQAKEIAEFNQQKIKEQSDEIENFFAYSVDLMCISNVEGYFLKLNRQWEHTLGYSLEELKSRKYTDFVHPDDLEPTYNAQNKLNNKENIINFTNRYRCKNGEYRWIEWKAYPFGDKVFAAARDITERIEYENAILQAKQLVEKSEEKYKFLAENIEDVIWIMDVESNHFTYVSPSVEKLRGYSVNEVMQQGVNESVTLESQQYLAQIMGERIQKKLKNPKQDFYYTDEIAQPCKNGSIVWTEVKTYYRINSENKLEVIGTSRNINDRKKALEDLDKERIKAQESDRLKTAFLQNMSHEIRTPMNAIMGFSELLIKQYNNKPKLEYYANIITQRSRDLLDIINEILDIAKIESGQLPLHFEDCKIKNLFAELSLFFKENKKRQDKQHINLSIGCHCDIEEMCIETDVGKLKQVLINLINNAIKFTDNGSINAGCKFDNDHQLVFYVSDTGIGIPNDKYNDIFERFTQLSANKVYGGTGLGLSIVKGLIELLGGKIWLTSELGKGTTFYFTLSYKITEENSKEREISDTNSLFNFIGKNALIVEDDMFNAEFLKELLEPTGLRIANVILGNEAISSAQNNNFDLILMDISLPDINGYDAIKQILTLKPKQKIIAQTAYASPDDRVKALNSGCVDYISKPINSQALLKLLNNYL